MVEIHPAANIFPMLTDEAYEHLKADIAENGQQENIVFYRGKLIDGRNRLRACEELGIEPQTCELDADADPVKFVLSINLHRRHLQPTQRAMCAAKLAGLPHGGDRKSDDFKTQNCVLISVDDAAALFGVSPRSVTTALEVIRKAHGSVIDLCERGQLSVSKAAKFVDAVPEKKKQAAIAKGGRKGIVEDLATMDEVEEQEEAEEEPAGQEEDDLAEVEELVRSLFPGRLAVAAARLESLAEKLRSEL